MAEIRAWIDGEEITGDLTRNPLWDLRITLSANVQPCLDALAKVEAVLAEMPVPTWPMNTARYRPERHPHAILAYQPFRRRAQQNTRHHQRRNARWRAR